MCCCLAGFYVPTATASTTTPTGSSPAPSGFTSGTTTRYWDCCKPSCSWRSNVANLAKGSSPVKACLQDGVTAANPNAINVCTGGGSPDTPTYTCNNNQPWADKNGVLYGFAALGGTHCCECYQLDFTSDTAKGLTMIVQITNTGADLDNNQFDIQMPGGGFGIYEGCAANGKEPANGPGQFKNPINNWGQRYGGVSARTDCANLPTVLQAGCYWRFDSFKNSNNPNVNSRRVQCPASLTQITGCVKSDDSTQPLFTPKGNSSSILGGAMTINVPFKFCFIVALVLGLFA